MNAVFGGPSPVLLAAAMMARAVTAQLGTGTAVELANCCAAILSLAQPGDPPALAICRGVVTNRLRHRSTYGWPETVTTEHAEALAVAVANAWEAPL